jgi:hypothetical protein
MGLRIYPTISILGFNIKFELGFLAKMHYFISDTLRHAPLNG